MKYVVILDEQECIRANAPRVAEEHEHGTLCLTHIKCDSCNRVFKPEQRRFGYDRAAIRRDYVQLGKLLAKKGK